HLFTIDEPLDHAAFQRAMQRMEQQHDALRLRFQPDASGRLTSQTTIEPSESPSLEKLDLSGMAEEQLPSAIAAACSKVQASLNLTNGPLWRALHIDLGPNRPG